MDSGPFSTSTTGNLTLATWTGFTSYLDQLTATGINTESWPTTVSRGSLANPSLLR